MFQLSILCKYKAVKMNKGDENGTEEDNQEKEEDSQEDTVNVVTCKEDLNPFFVQSDHSINKVHFSEVNSFL